MDGETTPHGETTPRIRAIDSSIPPPGWTSFDNEGRQAFQVEDSTDTSAFRTQSSPVPIVAVGVGVIVVIGIIFGAYRASLGSALGSAYVCSESQSAICTGCQDADTCTGCVLAPNKTYSEYNLVNGVCDFQCNLTLHPLHLHCATCSDSDSCTACDRGYAVNSSKLCEFQCVEHQVAAHCSKCVAANTCTACAEYSTLDLDTHGDASCKCLDTHEVLNGICACRIEFGKAKCSDGKCSDALTNTCTECHSGYALNSSELCEFQCVASQKASSCTKCVSDKVCTACDAAASFVLDVQGNGVTSCKYVCNAEQKENHCTLCSDSDTCTECDDTSVVDEGKCVCKIENGDGCKVCSDGLAKECKECHKGYTSFFGECLDDTLHEVGACSPAPEGHQFYTYRAINNDNYKFNGINTASSGGVIRYVHEEVVGVDCCSQCDKNRHRRKYDIDRIKRFKMTMMNVGDPRQFRNFQQFDLAKCTVPKCDEVYQKEGYNVGCQVQHVDNFHYHDAAWYSWPGTCPSQPFTSKSEECIEEEPGGECEEPDGSKDCTYKMEPAGEIYLDDLVGIGKPGDGTGRFEQFCRGGGVEFVLHPETCSWCKPPTINFWKERTNRELNTLRTRKLIKMFRQKYPDSPNLPSGGLR